MRKNYFKKMNPREVINQTEMTQVNRQKGANGPKDSRDVESGGGFRSKGIECVLL